MFFKLQTLDYSFLSGNKEELRAVHKELRWKIKEGKNSYRKKMEDQLQQNNVSLEGTKNHFWVQGT